MKRKWVFYGIALVNMALLLLYVARLPNEVVAVHYGISGAADRFGSKWSLSFGALLPPVLLLLYYEVYCRVTINNPRIMANRRYEDRTIPWIALVFVGISWFMVLDHGDTLDMRTVSLLFVLMGLLMIFLSNIMAKLEPNRWFGYRLPWTLKDDEVWRQTHRLAGYCGVGGGFTMVIAGLAGLKLGYAFAIAGFIVGLLLMVVPPAIFAYNMYHKLHD